MRSITASRIQNARRTHLGEGDKPNAGLQRYRKEQPGKHYGKWNPPREQVGASAAEPVARGVRLWVTHDLLTTARAAPGSPLRSA